MFCSECGATVGDDAKFCGECGAVQASAGHVPKAEIEQVVSKATVINNAVAASDNTFKSIFRAVAVIIGVIWFLGLIVYSLNLADNQQLLDILGEKEKHDLFRNTAFQFFFASALIKHFSANPAIPKTNWKGWSTGRRVGETVYIIFLLCLLFKFLF